ncbi:5-formyltetrahydrofolate cyclo-ligase [Ekhidna sp.]|uniref:5-formyltetrahydrofolate cyclo-ligase n=1 Tax=Ekhidna sp. TaxID=2608089 RepID=UPI0032ED00B9
MITKTYIRKVILQYRVLMDRLWYDQRNKMLCQAVAEFIKEKRVEQLHTFLAIAKNNEPDISSLFPSLWAKRIMIVVSKTDFMFKQMHHYCLEEHTDLFENSKGIPEPVDARETHLDNLDVIFVPLLLADQNGNRIGYGGGYYDRLLKETKALRVGLSLSPPVDRIIQTEKWDVPLDYLITPFKTYNYG